MYLQKPEEKIGQWLGFVFSYGIFTLAIFFALMFMNKLPLNWSIINISGITMIVTILGMIIPRLLK